MSLSQPFPFYGRYVREIVLTTAGGMLIKQNESTLLVPSYISPFMTALPPSDEDEVLFYDELAKGGIFFVQWNKHFGSDDRDMLKMQMHLYMDGSVRFLYQRLGPNAVSFVKDKGFSSAIGLMDGFAAAVQDKPDGK